MANNSDWNVHIPARKKCTTAKQEVVRVSADAYNALVEIYNESTLSMKELSVKCLIQVQRGKRSKAICR